MWSFILSSLLPAIDNKPAAESVKSNQFVMRALLNDLAEINNKDHASISYRFEPVSDHDNRLIVRKLGFSFSGSTLAVASSRMIRKPILIQAVLGIEPLKYCSIVKIPSIYRSQHPFQIFFRKTY